MACLFLAAIGAAYGGWFVYFASLLLAAGLAGFLPFNYPRARIFMGVQPCRWAAGRPVRRTGNGARPGS